MSPKKPGTGPARKQKQRPHSHCSRCSNATSGVGSSSDTQLLPTEQQVTQPNSVFGGDTQKSMCVKDDFRVAINKIIDNPISSGIDHVRILQDVPHGQARSDTTHKQPGNVAQSHKSSLVGKDSRLGMMDILDLLSEFIAAQEYNPKVLNPIWTKNATGTLVSCGCGRKHYPFHNCKRRKDGYWDVESQVLLTYDRIFDEIYKVVNVPHNTPEPKKKRMAPILSQKTGEPVDNSTEVLPTSTTKVVKRVAPKLQKQPDNTYSPVLSETSSLSGSNTTSTISSTNTGTVKQKRRKRRKPVSAKPNKVNYKHDKHQNAYIKKAPHWIQQELNVQQPNVVSAPVLDNHKPEKDLPHLGMPEGDFNLVYTPPFWKFWHKQSWFRSNLPFNHDAHELRKLAKANKLKTYVIKDDMIIDSLYAYLMRNRNATYESYNIKLNHLHKLAQAWESAEMPKDWRKKVNSPNELNFFFNTIGKVANCSDPEILLSQQKEDRHPSLFKRLKSRLFGQKLKST